MKRLSKNFFSIIGSDVIRRLVGFIAVAYLARKVGAAGFGLVNLGFTVLSYAMMISSAGLQTFGTREVARVKSSDIVSAIVSSRLLNASISFIVVTLIATIFVADGTTANLFIIFALSLFANAFLLDWYYQGREEMGIIGSGRLLSAVIYLVILMTFVHSSRDILLVALAAVAGDIAASAYLYMRFRQQGEKMNMRLPLADWKSLMKKSFPLGAGAILAHCSVNLPPIVIGMMMTNADVGIFSAASKLVFVLLMFDRVLGTILLPASARLHAASPESFAATLGFAMKWIVAAALPLCVGGTMLAEKLIPFVFGPEYASSVDIFRIIIWFFLFTTIHTIYTAGVVAIGEEKSYGRIMAIGAVVYGVSIIVGTKLFGLMGTAVAFVVSEGATLLLMRQAFRRFVKVPFQRSHVLAAVSSIAMGIVLWLLPAMHVVVVIIVGAVSYCVLMMATRAVTQEDFAALVRRF